MSIISPSLFFMSGVKSWRTTQGLTVRELCRVMLLLEKDVQILLKKRHWVDRLFWKSSLQTSLENTVEICNRFLHQLGTKTDNGRWPLQSSWLAPIYTTLDTRDGQNFPFDPKISEYEASYLIEAMRNVIASLQDSIAEEENRQAMYRTTSFKKNWISLENHPLLLLSTGLFIGYMYGKTSR